MALLGDDRSLLRRIISPGVIRHFLLLLSFAAVAIIISIVGTSSRYEHNYLKQIEFTHDNLALRMAKEMGLFFELSRQQLVVVADVYKTLQPNVTNLRITLNDFAKHTFHFEEISFIDRHGVRVATSAFKTIISIDNIEEVQQHSQKNRSWISPVRLDNNRIPYTIISAPIVKLGKLQGVLIARMSLKKLWNWIDQINELSATNLTVVSNNTGIIIADQSKALIGKQHPYWGLRTGPNSTTLSPDGAYYLSFHHVPNIGLSIITSSPRETFLRSLYDTRYYLVILAILLIVVSAIYALWLSLRTTRPVATMVDAISGFARSDDTRMQLDLPDDYRLVAEAFNTMADDLAESRHALVQQESLAIIGRLASHLAHEMRHGMHVIQNMAFLIEDGDLEAAQLLRGAVSDLGQKVQDLLNYTRSSRIYLENVEIDMLISETISRVDYIDLGREVDIDVENHMPGETITIDRSKIISCLSNLIRNAIDAGATKVSMRAIKDNGMVSFSVIDNGSGIPPEQHEKIWQAFETTKQQGFGIGLSIVQTVAKAHGGTAMLVESGAGGSHFRITLPLVEPVTTDDFPYPDRLVTLHESQRSNR